MRSGRFIWVDWAKALGILLVVMGHSHYSCDDLTKMIYMFHMPAFFVCSGFLFCPEIGFKKMMQRNIRHLVFPWVLYNLFYFSIYAATGLLKVYLGQETQWDIMLNEYLRPTLLGYSFAQFCFPTWFLLSLFWCRLLGYWFEHSSMLIRIAILCGCTLLFSIRLCTGTMFLFCIDTGLAGFLWFLLGMLYRHLPSFNMSIWLRIIIIPICFIGCYLIYRSQGECSYITCDIKGPMGLLGTGLGIIAFLGCCQSLDGFNVRIVREVSKATLFIMCTHALFIIAFEPYIPYPGSFVSTFLFDVIIVLFLTAIKHKFHWPY